MLLTRGMWREIVLSPLLLLLYIWPAAGAFNNCSDSVMAPDLTYKIKANGPLLFCPDTGADPDNTVWAFSSCNTPSTEICRTGTFSFEGQFPSDSPSCFGADSGQACVLTENEVSTLYVCVSGLTAGTLEFIYTPHDVSPISFTVEYAPIGISLLMDKNVVDAVVGSQETFGWQVRRSSNMNDEYALFHVTSNAKELLFGTAMTENNNRTGVSLLDSGKPCITSEENRLPVNYLLRFDSVNFEDSGIYNLEVVIFDNKNQERSFASNITLNVLPSSSMPTSTSAPMVSAGTTSSMATSPTDASMNGFSGPSILIVIVVLAVVAVMLIAATLIVILVTYFWRRRQNTDSPESGEGNVPNGSTKGKYTNTNRTSAASDKNPLVASSTPSPGTTPTTKTPNDFVGLLYEDEYANSYSILKGKYPDQVRELPDVESVISALNNQYCKEIIIIVNLRTSQVFIEMSSRAIPMDGREKVKFVLFGKDSTPGKNIEAQGYRVVVLDGDPQEEDTFGELLIKLEQPVFRQVIPSPAHLHGRMNSDTGSLPMPTLEERPLQGRSETDHAVPANDRMASGVPVTLPAEMTKFMEKQIELQEASLEESKKRNVLLENINMNASSINRNTAGMQDALETAVVDESVSSSAPP